MFTSRSASFGYELLTPPRFKISFTSHNKQSVSHLKYIKTITIINIKHLRFHAIVQETKLPSKKLLSKGWEAPPDCFNALKKLVSRPWVIPKASPESSGLPQRGWASKSLSVPRARPGNPLLRTARAPQPRISPPSPNNRERRRQHGRTRRAAATHRLQARDYGGGGFCSASKPPSPSRERRGTERAKPTSTDELVAGHPNVSTDLLLLSLPTKWRQRRALKRGREARRPIKTRFRATRPMIRGPPPVAGARRGRGRGVGCGRRFEILPERSMSGITAAVPVAGPLQGPGWHCPLPGGARPARLSTQGRSQRQPVTATPSPARVRRRGRDVSGSPGSRLIPGLPGSRIPRPLAPDGSPPWGVTEGGFEFPS